MKKGCLILLLIWIVLSALYYQVLQGTELADQIWVPILYGLSGVLVIANLQGLRMVFGMRSAAKRAPHEWKAGSLVGFSGRIQAVSKALIAPFSGKEAVIIEYEIERRVGSGKSTSMQNHFMGFLMTPCTVYSARGPVRLIGFPLLAQIHPASDDPYSYEKAARYLAAAKFKELQKNPLTLVKEINAVLADDDGDLQVDFISPDVALPEGENEKPEEPGETGGIGSARELSAKEQGILNYLRHGGYTLKEVIIENGATVTVFGTYHPAKSAVDIGSALKNLRHQIHLGPIEKVLGAQLRNSILGIIFWGAVWAGAHWYLAKLLGYPIDLRFDLSFLG